MKVLLIQPSRFREDGRLDKRRRRWLLGMTLPYVAALTPPDIRVEIKDDMLEDITFREDCDLVGLTCMSHQAPRAYQLAAGFRRLWAPPRKIAAGKYAPGRVAGLGPADRHR